MGKRKSRLEKLDSLKTDSLFAEWCIVDTNNVFTLGGQAFVIDEEIEQYRVLNKPKLKDNGQYNDWTNDSVMDKILCIAYRDGVRFFDESIEEIDSKLIKQV